MWNQVHFFLWAFFAEHQTLVAVIQENYILNAEFEKIYLLLKIAYFVNQVDWIRIKCLTCMQVSFIVISEHVISDHVYAYVSNI